MRIFTKNKKLHYGFFDIKLLKFIISGILNTLLRNLLLLILIDNISIGLATFISGFISVIISFKINSKVVFNAQGYISRFIFLIISIWTLEWITLRVLILSGVDKVIAVLSIIPFFAICSYLIQKYFIFKKRQK